MEPRIEYMKASPELLSPLYALEQAIRKSGLEHSLLDLIKLRASQVNGCAYCIDMHWKDARKAGETEQRLYGLSAWEEAPYYSPRERAALKWTDAVTLISATHAPDADFDSLREHFSDEEIVKLTVAIAAINLWNRLGISMRAKAGDYKPAGA